MGLTLRFTGIVQSGKKRGKRLGFPTINFPIDASVEEGIYISQTEIEGTVHNSLTFIGTAKTFGENVYQAETYIFDFNENIYGKNVSIVLLKKIRGNKKFDSESELIKEMENDKKTAEAYFKQNKK